MYGNIPQEFFTQLTKANYDRHQFVFSNMEKDWSTSEWMGALLGEIGEAANIAKKMHRLDTSMEGATVGCIEYDDLTEQYLDEIADCIIYLDILCRKNDIYLHSIHPSTLTFDLGIIESGSPLASWCNTAVSFSRLYESICMDDGHFRDHAHNLLSWLVSLAIDTSGREIHLVIKKKFNEFSDRIGYEGRL